MYTLLRSWEPQEFLEPISQESNPAQIPDYTPYIQQIESLKQSVKEAEDHNLELSKENEAFKDSLLKETQEKEEHSQIQEHLRQEFTNFKETALKEIDHNQGIVMEQQRTLAELRETLESKQQHITQLESKTRDLNYELKVLLQLTEKPVAPEPTPTYSQPKIAPQISEEKDIHIFDFAVRTQEEAHVHLKRILDVAQRITGSSPFSSSSRFKDLPLDNYALDIRRLLDSLKEITATTIFVFSLKENKLLFVNDHVKELLGMSAEKFLQTFQDSVHEEWQEAIRQLAFKNEAKVYLTFENSSGKDVSVDALVSPVPTGLFKNHLIGILYPSGKRG